MADTITAAATLTGMISNESLKRGFETGGLVVVMSVDFTEVLTEALIVRSSNSRFSLINIVSPLKS
ncbi:MAG: hypothetical protein ACR2GU_08090 [Rubrobacteraceae bacterium]